MRSILMACNSDKLKFQGKCFAHLIRKNGYFGISSLRTCQHFLPWPSHTLHVQHNEGQTFMKPYSNIMLWISTNFIFFFLNRIIKKVTFSLSETSKDSSFSFPWILKLFHAAYFEFYRSLSEYILPPDWSKSK